MKRDAENNILHEVCEKIKREGRVEEEDLKVLSKIFGQRFMKAWTIVKNGNVKKYHFKPSGKVIWIVVGKEREYIVMPAASFCTCDDFYYRVMDGIVYLCYHLIAQRIAESLGWYDLIVEDDMLYDTLMKEWKRISIK